MKSGVYVRIVAGAIFATLALGGQAAWARGVCQTVNGLNWCYNPDACGQPCNDVCAAAGSVPIADDAVWYAAQDTPDECQAIATAFGLTSIYFSSWTYGCVEDTAGTNSSAGELLGPLLCSSSPSCPAAHRTDMDQNGIPCGENSRHSICPCKPARAAAPALGSVGLILCAGLLLLFGVTRLRYRRI